MSRQEPTLLAVAGILLAGCAGLPPLGSPPESPIDPGLVGHPDYGFPQAHDLAIGDSLWRPGISEPTVWHDWLQPAARPVPGTPSGMRENQRIDTPDGGSTGMAAYGHLLFAGPPAGPLGIVLLTGEDGPIMVAQADAPARDVGVIPYPDGRLIAVTTGGAGGPLFAVDVTNPYAPALLATVENVRGSHNVAVVPGTPIVYSVEGTGRRAALTDLSNPPPPLGEPYGATDIMDFSRPEEPVLVGTWKNGVTCHAIEFLIRPDLDLFRAYCAGVDTTQVWDIRNATNPTLILDLGWPTLGQDGQEGVIPATFSHWAEPNHDGTVLLLGDESGGGFAGGCDASLDAGGQNANGPLGNVWFYDLADEANPVLRGHVGASADSAVGKACTAHFGDVLGDLPFAAVAFYNAGVLLIDFTNLEAPHVVDQWRGQEMDAGLPVADVWDVVYHQGRLFASDRALGLVQLEVS